MRTATVLLKRKDRGKVQARSQGQFGSVYHEAAGRGKRRKSERPEFLSNSGRSSCWRGQWRTRRNPQNNPACFGNTIWMVLEKPSRWYRQYNLVCFRKPSGWFPQYIPDCFCDSPPLPFRPASALARQVVSAIAAPPSLCQASSKKVSMFARLLCRAAQFYIQPSTLKGTKRDPSLFSRRFFL